MSTGTFRTTTTRRAGSGRWAWPAGLAEGLVMLAGLYLVIATWLVGYGPEIRLVLSDLVCGLALFGLGLAHALSSSRIRAVSWVIPVIGAWVAVSPLAFYHGDTDRPTATVWASNAVAGGIVVLAGILLAARPGSDVDHRRERG